MSTPIFTVEMLAAKHGDAIWIEYSSGTRKRRILIDGGPLGSYATLEARFKQLPQGDQRLELLVITHVDTDHIEGMIRLLATPRGDWLFEPNDIWFNGYRHVSKQDTLGGREGEFLGALIHLRAYEEWNRAFAGGPVMLKDTAELPRIELADGMVLTLLSPDKKHLNKMARQWEKEVSKWAIDPGDLEEAWKQLVAADKFSPNTELTLGPEDMTAQLRAQLKGQDSSSANGSSIAFLAEFKGKSCLFLADAHMKLVCASVRKLIPPGSSFLRVDAVKVSHHGSLHNITHEFMELVDAEHFLFSTNGEKHKHPNPAAVNSVIQGARRKPTLWFNYRSQFTEPYESASLLPNATYVTKYPQAGQEGIVLSLT